MSDLVLSCRARHVRRCLVMSYFILLYRVSSCYTAVCLSCRTVMHRRFCAKRLQRYCIFFIRARNLETFFCSKSFPSASRLRPVRHQSASRPRLVRQPRHIFSTPPPPLFHPLAASFTTHGRLFLLHTRRSPAVIPLQIHCFSATILLFFRCQLRKLHGKKTAKGRQQDRNDT